MGAAPALLAAQSLIEIRDDVVGGLNADRDANQVVVNTHTLANLG
jgi:hypothetical protein